MKALAAALALHAQRCFVCGDRSGSETERTARAARRNSSPSQRQLGRQYQLLLLLLLRHPDCLTPHPLPQQWGCLQAACRRLGEVQPLLAVIAPPE
jgi:hypothetical protein